MRKIISIAVAMLLAGCATDPAVKPTPSATEAEQKAALIQYLNCLVPHANRLDDGHSDAKTIAQAMRGACAEQLEAVYETRSRGETAYFKQELRSHGAALEESSALNVVLKMRNIRRAQQQ